MALTFRGFKFSRIAVLKEFIENNFVDMHLACLSDSLGAQILAE